MGTAYTWFATISTSCRNPCDRSTTAPTRKTSIGRGSMASIPREPNAIAARTPPPREGRDADEDSSRPSSRCERHLQAVLAKDGHRDEATEEQPPDRGAGASYVRKRFDARNVESRGHDQGHIVALKENGHDGAQPHGPSHELPRPRVKESSRHEREAGRQKRDRESLGGRRDGELGHVGKGCSLHDEHDAKVTAYDARWRKGRDEESGQEEPRGPPFFGAREPFEDVPRHDDIDRGSVEPERPRKERPLVIDRWHENGARGEPRAEPNKEPKDLRPAVLADRREDRSEVVEDQWIESCEDRGDLQPGGIPAGGGSPCAHRLCELVPRDEDEKARKSLVRSTFRPS